MLPLHQPDVDCAASAHIRAAGRGARTLLWESVLKWKEVTVHLLNNGLRRIGPAAPPAHSDGSGLRARTVVVQA